jgi:hypothetical protein
MQLYAQENACTSMLHVSPMSDAVALHVRHAMRSDIALVF